MVHALREVERVLAADGLLIDLRPLLDRWPAEVAWDSGSQEAGRASDLAAPISDDAAANGAMEALASTGGFRRERQETFSLFYYWDTPGEMQQYIEEEWNDVIAVEDSVWGNLRSMWAGAGAEARVRMRMKMLITRYRKER